MSGREPAKPPRESAHPGRGDHAGRSGHRRLPEERVHRLHDREAELASRGNRRRREPELGVQVHHLDAAHAKLFEQSRPQLRAVAHDGQVDPGECDAGRTGHDAAVALGPGIRPALGAILGASTSCSTNTRLSPSPAAPPATHWRHNRDAVPALAQNARLIKKRALRPTEVVERIVANERDAHD